MKTKSTIKSLFIIALLFCASCGKKEGVKPEEDKLPEEEETTITHTLTFKEGETGWKYEADGKLYQGETRIINSTETDKTFPLDFMGTQSQGYPGRGGFGFLPQQTGTFKSGHDFGKGNGTSGNNYYLTGSVIIDGETYYAYSSHAYGFRAEDKIDGADCTVKITKYDGKYTTYKTFGITVTGFIGTVEGLFAGTFKTKDGSKNINITKGEFRADIKLPSGAEIID